MRGCARREFTVELVQTVRDSHATVAGNVGQPCEVRATDGHVVSSETRRKRTLGHGPFVPRQFLHSLLSGPHAR